MKYLLTLIILTTAAASVMACSVIPSSFCYEADRAPDEVIVSGTITGVDADGIDFEIRDVIRGTESRAVIRIWDGTDGYCNGVISMAADEIGAVGESFVLLLPVIDSLENHQLCWQQTICSKGHKNIVAYLSISLLRILLLMTIKGILL